VTVRVMSDGELTRLELLRDLDQRRLTVETTAQLLGLERRQVFRLLKAYRSAGATGLISRRRGRPSNRRKPEEVRDEALAIIRKRYWDFGPTLAAEKLREVHGIALGRETLRLWMIDAGIWTDRKQRRKRVHQPRHRRECVGELVQMRALVVRGSRPAMHAAGVHRRRDEPADASSVGRERVDFRLFPCHPRLSGGLGQAGGVLQRPASGFSGQPSGRAGRQSLPPRRAGGMTQFGRALHALNIDIICANSSQAKSLPLA
jgi:hypothetical protein